jgi:hypothetical protein
MSRVSPTIEGFRAAFRSPSLTFAEIAWRWAMGATVWALLLFSLFEYLNTLPVTNSDAALLSTRQPALVGRALAHILHGSLSRVVLAAFIGTLTLSCLWIIAASLGRSATLGALLEHFRSRFAGSFPAESLPAKQSRPFRSLAALHFLRLALALAAILALVGGALLAGFASPKANPRPGLALLLFLPLAALVGVAVGELNWLLSLAGVFAVRDGEDAMGAISGAVAFLRERTGAVFAVSSWTGMAHLVAFSIFTTLAAVPLSLLQVAPGRIVLALTAVVTLVYCAIADWLYIARLAGYICIAEMPAVQTSTLGIVPPPDHQPAAGAPIQTTIDRNETILSDVPNLGFRT